MPKGVYARKKETDSPARSRASSSSDITKTPQQSVPKLLIHRLVGKAPFSTPGAKKKQKLTIKDVEEEDEGDNSDSDLEPLSEKVPTESDVIATKVKSEVGGSGNEEESGKDPPPSKPKRKYKKRKFSVITGQRGKPKTPKSKKKAVKVENIEEQEKAPEKVETPEPEALVVPMPSRTKLEEYSELQLLLDNLLRTLQRKDPEQYFALPVTDEIAPNYSTVITKPMDFYTMRTKLDSNSYGSVGELKEDVELICSNAMLYNVQNTVYHQAAKKLLTVSDHVFGKENLGFLLKTLPFVKSLTWESLGLEKKTEEEVVEQITTTNKSGVGNYSCVADDMTAEELLMQAKRSAAIAADKLAARKPNTRMAFLKQAPDGSTTLNFITSDKCSSVAAKADSNTGADSRVVKLGDLIPKLKEGTPGLPAYSEPQNNLCVPVSYLDYGPYSSFAPQYDSTWATLNKEDSDLLLRTYGDQAGAQYAWSLKSFASGATGFLSKMVTGALDAITDGEHSKTVTELENKHGDPSTVGGKSVGESVDEIDFESLKSLENLGIDVSYLVDIEKQCGGAKETQKSDEQQKLLDRNGMLLSDLRFVQYQRLNKQPDFTLTRTEGPSIQETKLAGDVLDNFQKIIPQVSPGQIVSESSIRGLIGIGSPQDEIDMDVLNEFLVPE